MKIFNSLFARKFKCVEIRLVLIVREQILHTKIANTGVVVLRKLKGIFL